MFSGVYDSLYLSKNPSVNTWSTRECEREFCIRALVPYLFGQAVESSNLRMRSSAHPPHLLPLLLFTAMLNSMQHGLNERLPGPGLLTRRFLFGHGVMKGRKG